MSDNVKIGIEVPNNNLCLGTKDMHVFFRHALLDLLLFLGISTIFFSVRNVDLLAPLAENTRIILGDPPPVIYTTMAVSVYTVTAAILIINRILNGLRPPCKWSPLFFRTIFYLFYAVANALPENFMGVFSAGLFLLGLEQLHLWTFCVKSQPKAESFFGKL